MLSPVLTLVLTPVLNPVLRTVLTPVLSFYQVTQCVTFQTEHEIYCNWLQENCLSKLEALGFRVGQSMVER